MTTVDLVDLDATALAQMVRVREISARQLIEATLQRIEDVEPAVNAFRSVMADTALAEANRIDALADRELAALDLAGVPIAVKDDTDVAGQSTMWGSGVDRGVCGHDAEAVHRLRRAGAIVIGKTNLPELALWPWTAADSFGVTRNPWDPERTPGGSSGGSAAAVCAGMAAMGLGSDGGGSIRYPAGLTGLVGVKPQRGRVPVGAEHASAWHGLLVLGPLTRSVRDAASFLDVTSTTEPSRRCRDALGRPQRRLRIAVSTNPPPGTQITLSAGRRRAVDEAAELLSDLGHEVSEVDIPYGFASLWNSTVRLLKGVQDDVDSLVDRRSLEARTRAVARLGRLLPKRPLDRALQREEKVAGSINRVFETADVVLTPLCELPAPRVEDCPSRGAVRSLKAANTSAWLVPWNVIGQPALTVPIGLDDHGLPSAIHLAGRPDDETCVLALAAEIEAARAFPRWSAAPPSGSINGRVL
jgi:amidase